MLRNSVRRVSFFILIALLCSFCVAAQAELYVYPVNGVRFNLSSDYAVIDLPNVVFAVQSLQGVVASLTQKDTKLRSTKGLSDADREAFVKTIISDTSVYTPYKWLDDGYLILAAEYDSGGFTTQEYKAINVIDGELYEIKTYKKSGGDSQKTIIYNTLIDIIDSISYFPCVGAETEPMQYGGDGSLLTESKGSLTLDVTGIRAVTVDGKYRLRVSTEPQAFVRVSVGKQGTDDTPLAFGIADDNGKYEADVSIGGEDGEYSILVEASKGTSYATRLFETHQSGGSTPLLLRHNPPDAVTGTLTLYAYSAQGAQVELRTPSTSIRSNLLNEGYSFFTLNVRRGVTNTYKATATLNGVRSQEIVTTASRERDAGREFEAFRNEAKPVRIGDVANASSGAGGFEGKRLSVTGEIVRVYESDGYPAFTLRDATGEIYVRTSALLMFEVGDKVTVFGECAGLLSIDDIDLPLVIGYYYIEV